MVHLKVQGKLYELTEDHKRTMIYLQQIEAIQKGEVDVTVFDQKTFEFILRILKELDYVIPDPPKVNTNVLEDVIGKPLASLIGKLDNQEINNLYRAVHFLKIPHLRKSIAAVTGTRVYIKPTLEDYEKKREELKLPKDKELTADISKDYKSRYPFMN